jgi:hypothetical protein
VVPLVRSVNHEKGDAVNPKLPHWLRELADDHPSLASAVTAGPRPHDPEKVRYVLSFLFMRSFVGTIGFLLPALLVAFDIWLSGERFLRDSLSAYYYSGARELFVGALTAIAVFLVCYKVAENDWDNRLTWLAGVAVVLVAVCPTGTSEPGQELTALQARLGESLVQSIHFVAAFVFISSLAVISFLFGAREGSRPRRGRQSPRWWRNYHWASAGVIVAALAWIGVTELTGLFAGWSPSESLFWGEVVAIEAFALSWLMKGMELDFIFRRDGAVAEGALEQAG